MDWEQLEQYFDRGYDYMGRIVATDPFSQRSAAVPALLRLSAGLALRAMSSDRHNRLVILLPNRVQCAQWIVTLCGFEVMRGDYENRSGDVQFSRGQRLLVGGRCVVEYLGEEFDAQLDRWLLWVACSNESRYGVPLDRKLAYQPVNTRRPLSSLERVSAAVNSAERLEDPVDRILKVATLGNRSWLKTNVILVAGIGDTERFVKESHVNGSRIVDLITWGKLNVDGEVSVIRRVQIGTDPCCLVSHDLFGAWRHVLNTRGTNRGIIVDGSSNCIDNLQVLDDILDQKTPVVVICDLLDTCNLHYLVERGFKVWPWSRNNALLRRDTSDTDRLSPFWPVTRSVSNYCNMKVETVLGDCQELDRAVDEAVKLGRLIADDQPEPRFAYGRLIQLVNDISRLIRVPERTWVDGFLHRLKLMEQQFGSQQMWLSDRAMQAVADISGILAGLAEGPLTFQNPKVKSLRDVIRRATGVGVVAIVVARSEEIEKSRDYWRTQFSEDELRNIQYVTVPDLLVARGGLSPDRIVVCGWLGGDKMFPLVHSNIAPQVTLLLYGSEHEWFASAQRSWARQSSFGIRADDFSGMLGLKENELTPIESAAEEPAEPARKVGFDILEFELRVRKYRYAGYAPSAGVRDQISRAKLVVFTGGKFAFITESHRLPVVTDLMRGEASRGEIPHKHIAELQAGDYVLFQESTRDIIREIADKGLAKDGLSHLRRVAGLWREALRDACRRMSGGQDALVELLRRAGCGRHPQTIRNWLVDEHQIGPGISTDLDVIARATGDGLLTHRLDEVKEAISRVRGAHLQASTYVRNKLLARLPDIIEGEKGLPGYDRDSMQLNLDEYGQVMILRVEEVGDSWEEVQTSAVDCLLSEED
jgi:hypothetical protein